MKEIREIKMVEQVNVRFIAEDGTEFIGDTAERDCKVYELTLTADAARAELAKLNVKCIDMPFGNWVSEGYDLYFAHFENADEYFIFKSCIDKINKVYDDATEVPKEFPCNEIYSHSYDGYFCSMSQEYFDKQLSAMKEMMQKLEKN